MQRIFQTGAVAFLFALLLLPARAELTEGLVGSFSFDKGTVHANGEGVTNGVAGGPKGSIAEGRGSVTVKPEGVIGGAVEIAPPGGVQFEEDADYGNFSSGSFTVSGWLRAQNGPSARTPVNVLAAKGRTNQQTPGWSTFLRFDATSNEVQLAFAATDRATHNLTLFPVIPGFELDHWYHWAVVVNRPARTVTVFLDGKALADRALGALGSVDSADPLSMGHLFNSGAQFDGCLDDVGIWSRALSAAEIERIYSNGKKGLALGQPGR
ncbi:hypothetical protein BH09VER1_BH09VER1_36040 [soil metagenome]